MRRPPAPAAAAFAAAAALLAIQPAIAQVSGRAYEDRNANGIRDPNEPLLQGVGVRFFGTPTGGATLDQTSPTDPNGFFSFAPGNGCYLVQSQDPAGWRFTGSRTDGFVPGPGYAVPIGQPRFSKMDQGIARLKTGSLRFAVMGDSIARNFNACTFPTAFTYSTQVRSRLACAAGVDPNAITMDQAAVLGEHTDDLLVDDTNDANNVFRAIENQPSLITISMIGNDMLDVDPGSAPTQTQINRAVAELIDSRANLQEAISAMTSAIPAADIALNSLYDQLAYNCTSGNTTTFHRQWLPIMNRILRDVAWGQTRRASISEVAAEFAHEDINNVCTGFTGMICRDLFGFDDIHPTSTGYTIVREKVWEGLGGALLGPSDPNGRTSIPNVDQGFLRRVRRLSPSRWEVRNGASATTPTAAFTDQDAGAPARITLGAGTEEFRLTGFPDWFDEIQTVKAIAGVRYRVTGAPSDDFYRMEASITGQFRPPVGFAYTATNWNWYTPIVGGGGPSQPPENPDYPNEKVLALPAPAAYRDVSASLTKNPVLPGGAGDYTWPAVTHAELATTAIRVAAAPVAGTSGNDAYQVELDNAYIDLYGWEKLRPPEVTNVQVDLLAGGTLRFSFDPVASAQRYNLYAGRVATIRTGAFDHGSGAPAGPLCAATTAAAGGGRLSIDLAPAQQPSGNAYFLITAHVDDVESPAGFATSGAEIDRSQSTCR